jgi:hypothetical protein
MKQSNQTAYLQDSERDTVLRNPPRIRFRDILDTRRRDALDVEVLIVVFEVLDYLRPAYVCLAQVP